MCYHDMFSYHSYWKSSKIECIFCKKVKEHCQANYFAMFQNCVPNFNEMTGDYEKGFKL